MASLAPKDLAGAVGTRITALIGQHYLRWILGVSFIAMAVWRLIPEKFDDNVAELAQFGVPRTTLIAFFLAEEGDKTQIATLALAAVRPLQWHVTI